MTDRATQGESMSDEDRAEAAYWQFDARRNGYGPYQGMPRSDRAAFKIEYQLALKEGRQQRAPEPASGLRCVNCATTWTPEPAQCPACGHPSSGEPGGSVPSPASKASYEGSDAQAVHGQSAAGEATPGRLSPEPREQQQPVAWMQVVYGPYDMHPRESFVAGAHKPKGDGWTALYRCPQRPPTKPGESGMSTASYGQWRPMNTAPRGEVIEGLNDDGDVDLVEYRDTRQCMLASVAAGAGECGPGWVSHNADCLPIDPPVMWRPKP